MHTVVPGWFGASSVWFIPLIWRLVKAALPGGAGLRGPGTIRLWLGFFCVLLASCALEAMLVDIAGFDALGHALAAGLGKLAGHAAAALTMTALFLVSLPWLLDFHWRGVLAWTDVSLGLGLNIRARRDDEGAARSAPRARRAAASEAPSPHGMAGMHALNTFDPQPTLDGSRRRRPTVWRPPATRARAAGGAAVAAAGSDAARAAAPSWRVEPSLSGVADTAFASARPEPVAPAGWLREPSTGAARAAAAPGPAFDSRRQTGLMGQPPVQTLGMPGAAPAAGPLPAPSTAIGNASRRAEPVRPPMPGPRTVASSASAALQAAQAAAAANAATRGFTIATSPDPITSPFASPPLVRRSGPPPVAGSTAARAAATAPTPRPPKPPRPFVWPTKSAHTALRPQTSTPPASTRAATPAYSRPAAPAQPASRAPLSTGVLETLRSIEENAARWTTLAGASLARRNGVDDSTPGTQATPAAAAEAGAQDAQFPTAAPVIAAEGTAAGEAFAGGAMAEPVLTMAEPVLDMTGAAEAGAAAPNDAGAIGAEVASWSAPAPHMATTPAAPDARAFDAAHVLDTQPTTPAEPVAALDYAGSAEAGPGLVTTPASTAEPAAATVASIVWAPATTADTATPHAAGWHTAPSLAAQVETAQPSGFVQSAWPGNERDLAPWILLDDESLEHEAPSEPASDDASLQVFAPASLDAPAAAAFAASAHMDAPTAANGPGKQAETAVPLPPALPAAPGFEPTADTANIVRFPRVAHDVQRAVADATSSDSSVTARAELPQTANWRPLADPAPSVVTITPAVATPWEPAPSATSQPLATSAPSAPTTTPPAAAPWAATPAASAGEAPEPPEPDPAPRQPARGHAPTSFEFQPLAASAVELPGLDLLERAASDIEPVSEQKLAETSLLIEQRLQEFKVPVTVVGASAGPVITRFEVEPALGVRGSQIVSLMKDLSRGLGLTSIRVVETIPGKTCMGLELPNARRQMIRLSEILESGPYQRSPSKLTIAMGKDIVGHPVVTDLAKAPHMLVAGTTGSGKSVAINAMILSLLYKATPEDVRLIMIDPKMLELSVYEGIPHLLAPVVTDMKLAANALTWCVGEMEKRYRLMSAVGVRNLAGFNQKIRDAEAQERKIGNPFSLTPEAPEPLAPLPMIVVVIDELADLMMVAGKKIEELIARLAQKARAAGIHLILATQRPSVDVITGLIKANIPTRVAFQVSSKIDSRTILDQMGAESLLGQGDMLFLPPGTGYPQRVHGAFVADEEVHAVVEYLKQFGEPEYVEGILDGPATEGAPQDLFGDTPEAEADPLYDEAVAFVVRTRRASISSVQRQLRIGYNRAARLVEQMEAAGLVSTMGINGSREVLVPGQPE